jgi:6-phosphogluconolactonase
MHDRKLGRAPTIVYAASALSSEIAVFVLDPHTATLNCVQRAELPGNVTPLAIDPRRRFLYAGLRGPQPAAIAYAIDPRTGLLRALGTTPLDDPPMYLATDAGGAFLLSASYAGATFTINAILADGEIERAAIEHHQTPPSTHSILTDPTNRYLFVAALGGDAILQFLFDASTGRVRPNGVPFVSTARGSGPRHMAFHPAGDVLYVNGELDGSISSYALEADTGRLRALARESMLAAEPGVVPWAAEVAPSPDGRYLYASERRTSTLVLFDLSGEPGALRRRAIVATEEQPRSFALDPRGRFLVLAGEKSNHLAVYAIDPATGLPDARSRHAVGPKPTWVAIIDLPAAP